MFERVGRYILSKFLKIPNLIFHMCSKKTQYKSKIGFLLEIGLFLLQMGTFDSMILISENDFTLLEVKETSKMYVK